MAIKFYKPTTPGRRNMTTMDSVSYTHLRAREKLA